MLPKEQNFERNKTKTILNGPLITYGTLLIVPSYELKANLSIREILIVYFMTLN